MKKNYYFNAITMLVLLVIPAMVYSQWDEPRVYYNFDDTGDTINVLDISGNGFDGTVKGNVAWVDTGMWNSGAVRLFGGDTDYGKIYMPAIDIDLTTSEGSVAMWVNCLELPRIACLWWAGSGAEGTDINTFGVDAMHMHIEAAGGSIWKGGEFVFYSVVDGDATIHLHSDPDKNAVDNLNAGGDYVNPVTVMNSGWHHVAAVYGSGTAKIYIDGTEINSWDYTGKGSLSLDSMVIGSPLDGNRIMIGNIDEFRLYDVALSGADITSIYEYEVSVPGLQNENTVSVKNFPNPAIDMTTVSFNAKAGKNLSINLVNITGEVQNVYNGISVHGTNKIEISLDNFNSGVYFVELQLGKDKSYAKLVIE